MSEEYIEIPINGTVRKFKKLSKRFPNIYAVRNFVRMKQYDTFGTISYISYKPKSSSAYSPFTDDYDFSLSKQLFKEFEEKLKIERKVTVLPWE